MFKFIKLLTSKPSEIKFHKVDSKLIKILLQNYSDTRHKPKAS